MPNEMHTCRLCGQQKSSKDFASSRVCNKCSEEISSKTGVTLKLRRQIAARTQTNTNSPQQSTMQPERSGAGRGTIVQNWEAVLKGLPIVAQTPMGNMNTTQYNNPEEILRHLERLEMAGITPAVRYDHVYVSQASGRTAEYVNRYYRTGKEEWTHVLDAYYSD